jgi:homoserine kinase type II
VDTPTTQELSRILAEYEIGASCDCRSIRHGYVNAHWLVETTAGRYILKRRHPKLRDPVLIRAQHDLIAHLRDEGFAAPAIVPTRDGSTYLELGVQIYEVQLAIPGEPCNAGRPLHQAAAARTLARYHHIVRGFDSATYHWPCERYGPSALARTVQQIDDSWYGRTPASLSPAIAHLKARAWDLRARFDRFGPLPELVIHGDYHAHNLIVQGDDVVGVIDYDGAHWCSRAMEVAEALIYFAAERPGRLRHIVYTGPLDLNSARRFLKAYLQVLSLTDAEIEALPHLIATVWLCASLDPPLQPPLSPEVAPLALPEILILAEWAREHAEDIVAIARAARGSYTPGPRPMGYGSQRVAFSAARR